DGAQRMVRNRYDLKAEGQHVGNHPRFDDFAWVDVFFRAKREALVEVSCDRGDGLQVVCYAQVVKRCGHVHRFSQAFAFATVRQHGPPPSSAATYPLARMIWPASGHSIIVSSPMAARHSILARGKLRVNRPAKLAKELR